MSLIKTLSAGFLAALIFTMGASSNGFAQQPTSQVVVAKEKILAEPKAKTKRADKDNVSTSTVQNKAGSNNGSNNPGKCDSKTNPKCKPVSPSN
jgi:hypothetical protein